MSTLIELWNWLVADPMRLATAVVIVTTLVGLLALGLWLVKGGLAAWFKFVGAWGFGCIGAILIGIFLTIAAFTVPIWLKWVIWAGKNLVQASF